MKSAIICLSLGIICLALCSFIMSDRISKLIGDVDSYKSSISDLQNKWKSSEHYSNCYDGFCNPITFKSEGSYQEFINNIKRLETKIDMLANKQGYEFKMTEYKPSELVLEVLK